MLMSLGEKLKTTIRDVHNYPKPGIVFKDITPVLADPPLVAEICDSLRTTFKGERIDAIAGVEARGFIFGSILARELQCRFIPIRKKGRLPYKTRSQEYQLEYGTASIEIHEDAIQPGWRVLVHDDLLATGGTAGATADLVKSFDGIVAGFSFVINLGFLPGEQNLIDRFGVKPHYLVTF
jgi:adenine phosphoribosyltransferase